MVIGSRFVISLLSFFVLSWRGRRRFAYLLITRIEFCFSSWRQVDLLYECERILIVEEGGGLLVMSLDR